MGVPKFFRYISERYPCLSEFVREHQIPAFDNLYLDMNGIIHMCSHPDDNNPHFRISEEKIFTDIFHYIEFLFRMIKPQKVFFMAVDGVAPRAKMNQQRGRRFRSAKDAEKMEEDAKKKGEKLPDVARFDSNCITPGTEFMANLHEQLKYFVTSKVSTDKLWKKCKIILSGQETPGEGEHKIMDYIRYIRSQPGYDPNTRHCLYGLDADLIMLGLCTHDPHFSLLREEVKFGKKSARRNNVPEEIRFYLLHLSLLREYLELEFAPLKESLKKAGQIEFDIEKIIDDWILMGFLVGNDFIPNLPNLHIAKGALPVLYEVYIEVLPTLDGYINEAGTLNLERFEKFMRKLGENDFKNFEEIRDDLLYFETKTGRKQTAHMKVSSNLNSNNKDDHKDKDEDDEEKFDSLKRNMDPALAALIQETDELDIDSSEDEYSSNETGSSDDDLNFKLFKDEYYRNKLEFEKVTSEVMREQAEGYVRAIQWNLNYYYNGCCSWSWYYPHHYSPYVSDIKGFSNLKINFELGKPFLPFEQLLAVLPTASKDLLPKCYQNLMTDDESPIKQYYPEEFETDLNGKRQDWEAVVLVPFIDENILLKAMESCNDELTPEERKRNTHGPMLIYKYVDEDLGVYESPNYFPKVITRAECTPLYVEDIRVPREKLVKGAYPGAKFDVFYPGFPTFKHLKYEGVLKKAKVKIFEQTSRNDNMILKIVPNELYFEDSIPYDLLGKSVWVGWPHLVEAKIVAISNSKCKYIYTNDEEQYITEERKGKLADLFHNEVEGVTQYNMTRMGVDFGKTTILVHVKEVVGRKYVFTSNGRVNLEKQYCSVESNYPLQGIVVDLKVHDECYSTFREISDIFQTGITCFTLTNPYYGSEATVLESKESLKKNQLRLLISVVDEPDFSLLQAKDEKLKRSYLTLTNAASQLTMSNYAFSRITGCLLVEIKNEADGSVKNVNIGLDLKFNKKNQETPGYTRRIDNVWYYTKKAVNLVRDYIDKYPEVFDFLSKSNSDNLDLNELFPEDSENQLKSLTSWLKTLPTHNVERRVCGSNVLEPDVVAEIEKIVDEFVKVQEKPSKTIVMNLKPHLLYKPDIQFGNLMPDPLTQTRVFDRIVNVREGFTVPLGYKGTVIALYKASNLLDCNDEMYDVVFDKEFVGGMSLHCSEKRGYRLSKTSFINLTYGKREMEKKTGKPGELRALAKERQNGNSFQITNNNGFPFVNGRQQNSAFASFNKIQQSPPALQNLMRNNGQFNQYQFNKTQQFARQPFTRNKTSASSSFQYLTDFNSRVYEPKGSKGMSPSPQKIIESSRKESTKSASQQLASSSSLKEQDNVSTKKSQVDTDFLKKILKIDSSSANKNTSTEQFQPKQVLSSKTKVSSINSSATAKLLSYYQSNSLGCPRYTYFESNGIFSARVVLPNRQAVIGAEADSREKASENVAVEAIEILNTLPNSREPPSSGFPVPPMKWVQQNPNTPTQIFTNKSYQSKQLSCNYRSQHQNFVQSKKNNSDFNNLFNQKDGQQNYETSNRINKPSFVPLQAIMKRTTSKSDNINNKEVEEQTNGKEDQSKATSLTKQKSPEKKPETHKTTKQRRTRIAANFGTKP